MGERNGKAERDAEQLQLTFAARFILAGIGSVLFGFGLFLLRAPTLAADERVHMKAESHPSDIRPCVWTGGGR